METLPYRASWSHFLLRAWVIVWMLAVPLFHVHPEADHRHGEAGHVHGGTVHTVFSPDLDGEFDNHQPGTDGFGQRAPSHMAISGHPSPAAEYAELGFSFLSDSTDRKLPKPLFTHVLVAESSAIVTFSPNNASEQDDVLAPPHPFPTHDIPPRAPPSPLV